MLTTQSKILLKNTVAQTDTHNKVWEERLCWKQRELEKMHEKSCRSRSASASKTLTDKDQASCSKSNGDDPFHWTKKLHAFESADSERWGHAGYKDLYPEQFDEIKNKNVSSDQDRSKRKKRSHSSSSSYESRSKRSKKKKHKKSKRKKRKRS